MQHEYSEKEEGEGPISMGTSTDVVSMVTKDEAAMVTEETDNHCDLVTRAGENGVTGDRESVNEEGLTHSDNETETLVIDERSLDHFLFGVVQVLCKVFSVCVVGRSPVHRSTVNCILGKTHTHTHMRTHIYIHIHTHTHTHTFSFPLPLTDQVECLLLHPHSWVRLASSQLFGHLFAAYQPDDLVPVREAAAASEEGGKERRRKRRKSAVSVMDSDLPPEYLLKDPSTKVCCDPIREVSSFQRVVLCVYVVCVCMCVYVVCACVCVCVCVCAGSRLVSLVLRAAQFPSTHSRPSHTGAIHIHVHGHHNVYNEYVCVCVCVCVCVGCEEFGISG